MGISSFEDGIESFQDIPVLLFQQNLLTIFYGHSPRIQHIQQGLVIFIYQDNSPSARLFVRLFQHVGKAVSQISFNWECAIDLLPCGQVYIDLIFQIAGLFKFGIVEINMEHRIFEPVLFQLLHGQSLEQFFMSQEVVFKRGDKQTLAEPSGTAQEVDLTRRD